MKIKKSSLKPKTSKTFKSTPEDPKKTSFDWLSMLNSDPRFKAAPLNLFGHLNGAKNWPSLHKILKVEYQNSDAALPANLETTDDCYWVAEVVNEAGFYLQLRFEGFGEDHSNDFWVHILDPNLHQIGYSKSANKHLLPPKSIVSEQTDWKNYLMKRLVNSNTLPANFQQQVRECLMNRFRVGLKLEAYNVSRSSSVRPAKVVDLMGSRVQVAYEGATKYTPSNSFWADQASTLIHPVGWAQLLGHELEASNAYIESTAKKIKMGKYDKDDAGFDYFPMLFDEMKKNERGGERFQAGMRLEAIDALDHKYIRVAHVYKVLRYNYLMIGIDGHTAEDASDCFCYHKSMCLPINWCKENRVSLKVPEDWDSAKFNYVTYLKSVKAIAAPRSLFDDKEPDHGFKKGMYVEAVDLVEPHLICPAQVKQVAGQLIKISFVGWGDEYDQWLPWNSSEIYPIGWCKVADYHLEHPKVPDLDGDDIYVPTRSVNNNLDEKELIISRDSKKRNKKKSHGGKNYAMIEKTNKQRASSVSDTFDDSTDDSISFIETNHGRPSLKRKRANSFTNNSATNNSTNNSVNNSSTTNSMDYAEASNGDSIMVTEYDPPPASSNLDGHMADFVEISIVESDHPLMPAAEESTAMEVDESIAQPSDQSRTISSNPYEWSVEDLCHFLKINDLADCVEAFRTKQIDGRTVMGYNRENIYKVLDKLGPSLKVSHKVEELKRLYPTDRAA